MMAKSKLRISFPRDENEKGIWQFSSLLAPVSGQFKLSLGEGQTAMVLFAENLFLKREDQNPTGSLKDRGMAYLISQAKEEGRQELVLSSSGNAAISAAAYCQLAKIKLFVFVSPQINKGKLGELEKLGVKIFISNRPVSDAVKYAKEKDFVNLRPSENKFGPEGYQTIAFEILTDCGLPDDIFIPVSSGVALLGLAGGFAKLGLLPRIHLCQGTAICPLASLFDRDYTPEKTGLAEALVAKFTPLKKDILEIVRESGGTGWVISNHEVEEAQKTLQGKGILTSAEGALAFAAVGKARRKNFSLGKTVCLLTGKRYES